MQGHPELSAKVRGKISQEAKKSVSNTALLCMRARMPVREIILRNPSKAVFGFPGSSA